jgi:hypothetical protein
MKYCTLPLYSALDAVAGLEVKGTLDTEGAKPAGIGRRAAKRLRAALHCHPADRCGEEGKEAPPANGSRGPKKPSKSQNRLERLGEYREETLAFERRCCAL